MKLKSFKKQLGLLLTLCLVLSSLNSGLLVSYASPDLTWQVGENITAVLLEDGTLELTGFGDTWDYENDDYNRSPFYEERELITSVKLESGITALGNYLFYNCENLTGTLTIPATVIRIGEGAFSGEEADLAPDFKYVFNEFVATEITVEVDSSSASESRNSSGAKTEPEIPAESEAVGEPETPVESEVVTEAETPAESEAVGEPETPAESEVVTESETPVESEVATESETLVETETKAEATSEPETDLEAVPDSESETGTTDEPEPEFGKTDPIDLVNKVQQYEIKEISEQELGTNLFFPGQVGVFAIAEAQNNSFAAAATEAGYLEVLSWDEKTFSEARENTVNLLIPFTEQGYFLPDYAATNLLVPEDFPFGCNFLGWVPEQEEELVVSSYGFWTGESQVFTADWEACQPELALQSLSAEAGEQLVTLEGMLPVGGEVIAEPVGAENAAVLAGDLVSEADSIAVALDISILVDGVEYQPADYGENVQFTISQIEVPAENESFSVLRIAEAEAPEVIKIDSNMEDEVSFAAGNCSIYVVTASSIAVSAEAKLNWEPDSEYRSGAENCLYWTSSGDYLNYRLILSNNSSIVARDNFYYYLPIPKSDGNLPDSMLDSSRVQPQFSLELQGAVTVSGTNPDIYDLRYSLEAGADNYNDGTASFNSSGGISAVYYTADQIEARQAWDQVRMIKFALAEDVNYLPSNSLDCFDLNLQYAGADLIANAGKTVAWGGYGKVASNDWVKVMLRFEQEQTLTLTAANGTPRAGASKTAVISLPRFNTEHQELRILKLTTDNVELETSAAVAQNAATALGEVANGTFAITALLGGNGSSNIQTVELANGPGSDTLGNIGAGETANLSFTLTNYNALSDITTPRGVTVTLGDGAGILLTVRLNIEREMGAVLDPQTHIEGGKFYNLLGGTGSSVSITQDSAFTLQYIGTLNSGGNYSGGHRLSLLDGEGSAVANFPAGTTLTLVDLTEATPGYYYYKFNSADSQINLSEFMVMGSSGTYSDRAIGIANQDIQEKLLLIADFSKAASDLAAGSYSLRLTVANSDSTAVNNTITVNPKRTFELRDYSQLSKMTDSLIVSGMASASSVEGTDSFWQYRKMALKVTLRDSQDQQLDFPTGSIITMDGSQYVPSGSYFILPLGELGSYDYSYTFSTPHTPLEAGSYRLVTDLYVSATSNAMAPLGGSKEGSVDSLFTVSSPVNYALKVGISGDQHSFSKAKLDSLAVQVDYNQAAANTPISFELLEKAGEVYLPQSDLLNRVAIKDMVCNPLKGIAVYSASAYQPEGFTALLNLNNANFQIGKTYRLKVTAGNGNAEAVYNFTIME